MSRWLDRSWQRVGLLAVALYPISILFRAVVAARRSAYSRGLFGAQRLPVRVIVVGNISVGGTGKTPLVLWLTALLVREGLHPGIVSRGYGAANREPRPVLPDSNPARCGDEPVLLAQRSGCPVFVGADRVAAAHALLESNPECDVLVADDGLQHYRLARDIEIVVIDGTRGLGNGLLLPAGPLREPPSRLRGVDAVVVNGSAALPGSSNAFNMRLEGVQFRNLLNPLHTVEADYFQRKRVRAIAGTGNPARFFAHLNRLGMSFQARAFPDHHAYTESDLRYDEGDAVVMTEKDAVKCAGFASEKYWVLPVDAVPDPGLGKLVLRKLRL